MKYLTKHTLLAFLAIASAATSHATQEISISKSAWKATSIEQVGADRAWSVYTNYSPEYADLLLVAPNKLPEVLQDQFDRSTIEKARYKKISRKDAHSTIKQEGYTLEKNEKIVIALEEDVPGTLQKSNCVLNSFEEIGIARKYTEVSQTFRLTKKVKAVIIPTVVFKKEYPFTFLNGNQIDRVTFFARTQMATTVLEIYQDITVSGEGHEWSTEFRHQVHSTCEEQRSEYSDYSNK